MGATGFATPTWHWWYQIFSSKFATELNCCYMCLTAVETATERLLIILLILAEVTEPPQDIFTHRNRLYGSYRQLPQFCSRRTNLRQFPNRCKIFLAAVWTVAALAYSFKSSIKGIKSYPNCLDLEIYVDKIIYLHFINSHGPINDAFYICFRSLHYLMLLGSIFFCSSPTLF